MFTWPAVGVIDPSRIFSSVDLPAPFAPTMPKRSPGPISQVTSSSTLRPVTETLCAAEVAGSVVASPVASWRVAPSPEEAERAEGPPPVTLEASGLSAEESEVTVGVKATPASRRRGSVDRSSTANSTAPYACGSAYIGRTTSTRDAEAAISATSGSIAAAPAVSASPTNAGRTASGRGVPSTVTPFSAANTCVTSIRSTTCLPRREVAICFSSSVLRSGGTSAISSRACLTWNFCLVERARAPRLSHASSLRARLRRRASRTSACRSRSTRCSMYAL